MKLEDCVLRDVNLAEVARLIDYDRNYVCAVINGRYRPGRKFLKALNQVPLDAVKKKYIGRERREMKELGLDNTLKDLNSKENLIEEKAEVSDT
jgi:hypothetical protein